MSCVHSAAQFCAPLSLIAALLLFVMAGMLRRGSWTFAVIAQKHKWDVAQKARCCIHAAIFYLCISVLFWLLMYGGWLLRWCRRGRRGWRRAALDLSSCSEDMDKLSMEMPAMSPNAERSGHDGSSDTAALCRGRTGGAAHDMADVAPSTVLSRRMRALHHHQLRFRARVASPLQTTPPSSGTDAIYSPVLQTSPLYSAVGAKAVGADGGTESMTDTATLPRAHCVAASRAVTAFVEQSNDGDRQGLVGEQTEGERDRHTIARPAAVSLLLAASYDDGEDDDNDDDDDADFQSDVDPREMHSQHELYRSRFFATRSEATQLVLPAVVPMVQTDVAQPPLAPTLPPQRHGAATHALRPHGRRLHASAGAQDVMPTAYGGRSYRSRRRLAARAVMGWEDEGRDTDELISRDQVHAAQFWPI